MTEKFCNVMVKCEEIDELQTIVDKLSIRKNISNDLLDSSETTMYYFIYKIAQLSCKLSYKESLNYCELNGISSTNIIFVCENLQKNIFNLVMCFIDSLELIVLCDDGNDRIYHQSTIKSVVIADINALLQKEDVELVEIENLFDGILMYVSSTMSENCMKIYKSRIESCKKDYFNGFEKSIDGLKNYKNVVIDPLTSLSVKTLKNDTVSTEISQPENTLPSEREQSFFQRFSSNVCYIFNTVGMCIPSNIKYALDQIVYTCDLFKDIFPPATLVIQSIRILSKIGKVSDETLSLYDNAIQMSNSLGKYTSQITSLSEKIKLLSYGGEKDIPIKRRML